MQSICAAIVVASYIGSFIHVVVNDLWLPLAIEWHSHVLWLVQSHV